MLYSEYDSKEYAYQYTPGSAGPAITTSEITTDALGFAGAPGAACSFTSPIQQTSFTNTDCETILFNYMLGNMRRRAGAQRRPQNSPRAASRRPARSGPSITERRSSRLRLARCFETYSYQNFINEYSVNYTTGPNNAEPRHTVLYVATLDGILHAFGVDYSSDNYTYNGSNNDGNAGTSGTQNELVVRSAGRAAELDGVHRTLREQSPRRCAGGEGRRLSARERERRVRLAYVARGGVW